MKSFSDQNRSAGFAVVVLAAGGARGGQFAPYPGGTLVEHVARTALASGAAEVVVVAGDQTDEIRHKLRRLPVRVVRDTACAEGLSSSIRAGISGLRTDPAAAVVWLCDQAKVSSHHLRELAGRVLAPDGPSIAASCYDGILGAPAAFARRLYPELLALEGPAGARHLIRGASETVEAVWFPDAAERFETSSPRHVQGFGLASEAIPDPFLSGFSARAPPVAFLI